MAPNLSQAAAGMTQCIAGVLHSWSTIAQNSVLGYKGSASVKCQGLSRAPSIGSTAARETYKLLHCLEGDCTGTF